LTTNAVKHGAFVTADGKVTIRWTREAGREGDVLALNWTESGVAIDDSEVRENGFGMELLQRSLPYDLHAETSVEFRPDGLHFKLRMPLRSPKADG
jgi:two-component sensor histidine kinase